MLNSIISASILRFIIVGGLAFLVHAFCVILLVHFFYIPPLIANILGFLIAFSVSYIGHKNWSFSSKKQSHNSSLFRFTAVALIGFFINELSYALFLNVFGLDYKVGLFFSLIIASISTYILSNYWVFNKNNG